MRISSLKLVSFAACLTIIFMMAACASTKQASDGKTAAPKLPGGVPELIKILGEKHHPNRLAAIQVLSARGVEAADPLATALGDENADIRSGATQALAGMGTVAIPVLNQALMSQDPNVRYGAITALGQIGKDASGSITALMKSFGTAQSVSERIAIIDASTRIGPNDPQVLSLLQACLVVKDFRQEAMRALGDIGSDASAVVPRILPFLEDQDPQVRFETIVCLGAIGPAEGVVDGIAKLLKDADSKNRSKAAQVLGNLGTAASGATSALADVLSDSEGDVRKTAAKSLGQMFPDSAPAIPKLIKTLQDKDPQVRSEVANTLARFGSKASSAIGELKKLAESDEFDYVKTAASNAIKAIQGS
jgi:HEAT repeat protein